MAKRVFAVAATMACLLAGLTAGVAEAASFPRAEVRGVEDKALRTLIQQAIGDAPTKTTSRLEARRRAQDAAQKVIAVLRSQGYYDYEVAPDIGDGDSPVAFVAVTPGPQTKIVTPVIDWVGVAPDLATETAATKAMALDPGSPGQSERVIAAEGRVVAIAQKHGYADALAQPRHVVVDHANQTMQPTFRISAGPLVRMGGVKVEGKDRTHPRFVARLAPWKVNEIYQPDDVAELERRLRDTGVYDSVTVSLAPASQAVDGQRPVIVSLADRPKGTIELGASYATAEGVGVDSNWILYNRLGLADTLTNTFRIADIDSRLQSQLSLPDWRSPNQTLKLTGALYRERTKAYNDNGVGVSADVVHRYGKTSFFTYGASVDATETTAKEIDDFVLGSRDRKLIMFGLLGGFTLDRSNDPLDPTSGWKINAQGEPKFATGAGSITYLKISGQAAGYLPLGKSANTVIAARVKLGSIIGGQIPDVPALDRFFAGGGGSVRGYGYQLVGPRYRDNTPEGGLSLFETSIEVRQKLFGAWSVAAFADAGSVGLKTYPEFREPQVGVGFGVRYNLGFGPIRVDVATPLNRRRGDAPVQVYLSIGESF